MVTFDEKFRPIQQESRTPEGYDSVTASNLQVTVTPQGERPSIVLGNDGGKGD